MNVADTLWLPVIDTVHVPVPPQPAPLQPEKLKPLAGVAVKVTCAPAGKLALQADPQSMPEGALATEPLPVSPTDSV